MPLGEYVGGFYRGLVTGCNAAFVIVESVRQQLVAQDPRSDELIETIVEGSAPSQMERNINERISNNNSK